jgi:hypothetical protein
MSLHKREERECMYSIRITPFAANQNEFPNMRDEHEYMRITSSTGEL